MHYTGHDDIEHHDNIKYHIAEYDDDGAHGHYDRCVNHDCPRPHYHIVRHRLDDSAVHHSLDSVKHDRPYDRDRDEQHPG